MLNSVDLQTLWSSWEFPVTFWQLISLLGLWFFIGKINHFEVLVTL